MPCAARAGGTAWRLSGGEISSSLWQAPEARRSPIHSIHAARPLLSGPEGRAAPAGAPAGAPLGQLRGRVGCVWAEGILTLRRRVLVVMYLVELARLIPQHLEELRVGLGHAGQVDHTLVHEVDQRVAHARLDLAPRLLRRAHRGDHISRERAREVVVCARDEGVRLALGQEVVESHDPWPARRRGAAVDPRSQLGPCRRILEHGRDRARAALGWSARADEVAAVRVDPAARDAGARARLAHEAHVGVALSFACPQVAVGLGVLVLAVGVGG
mmetsp:Transcript_75922/g.183497  ORF Transcript_75922/g.183497 Transcript_75922/m.183497 type:complete len:272 (-) Transcript_75922:158-973(-)